MGVTALEGFIGESQSDVAAAAVAQTALSAGSAGEMSKRPTDARVHTR